MTSDSGASKSPFLPRSLYISLPPFLPLCLTPHSSRVWLALARPSCHCTPVVYKIEIIMLGKFSVGCRVKIANLRIGSLVSCLTNWYTGLGKIAISGFGEFCSCCWLPLLPQLAWNVPRAGNGNLAQPCSPTCDPARPKGVQLEGDTSNCNC